MAYRIPSDANSVIFINADKIFGSRVADTQRWNARRQAAYEAGLLALPPNATEVILAGRFDHEIGEALYEMGLLRTSEPGDINNAATRYGGKRDIIEDRNAARLPNDSFVIQLTDTFFASYSPANRQTVARWLRSTDNEMTDHLSPYLKRAFDYATKVGSPIIMALDMNGMFSPTEVKDRLASFEAFKESGINPELAAKIISGLQGITLGVTIGDDATGAIQINFSESPAEIAKVAKPMLLEILKRQGAMVDDFDSWEPSVKNNTFLLRGKLTTEGTRKVLSVLELPRSLADEMHKVSLSADDPESQARIASEHYWNSLTTLMDDLREKPKKDHVKTFGQAAIWYDRYARKIDNLPILNVDKDLLDFGAFVSNRFRDAEMAMKGVGMRGSQRTAMNNPSSGGYYVGGGYRAGYYNGFSGPGSNYGVSGVQASVREKGRTDAIIRGQECTRGAANVQQIWQELDAASADMRRKLTEKYQVEF